MDLDTPKLYERFFEVKKKPSTRQSGYIFGSGIPRILESYSQDSFRFSDNFLKIVLPASEEVFAEITQVSKQVTMQVEELLKVFSGEHTGQDLQERLELANRENFRQNYLHPAIEVVLVEMTIPDKPRRNN